MSGTDACSLVLEARHPPLCRVPKNGTALRATCPRSRRDTETRASVSEVSEAEMHGNESKFPSQTFASSLVGTSLRTNIPVNIDSRVQTTPEWNEHLLKMHVTQGPRRSPTATHAPRMQHLRLWSCPQQCPGVPHVTVLDSSIVEQFLLPKMFGNVTGVKTIPSIYTLLGAPACADCQGDNDAQRVRHVKGSSWISELGPAPPFNGVITNGSLHETIHTGFPIGARRALGLAVLWLKDMAEHCKCQGPWHAVRNSVQPSPSRA